MILKAGGGNLEDALGGGGAGLVGTAPDGVADLAGRCFWCCATAALLTAIRTRSRRSSRTRQVHGSTGGSGLTGLSPIAEGPVGELRRSSQASSWNASVTRASVQARRQSAVQRTTRLIRCRLSRPLEIPRLRPCKPWRARLHCWLCPGPRPSCSHPVRWPLWRLLYRVHLATGVLQCPPALPDELARKPVVEVVAKTALGAGEPADRNRRQSQIQAVHRETSPLKSRHLELARLPALAEMRPPVRRPPPLKAGSVSLGLEDQARRPCLGQRSDLPYPRPPPSPHGMIHVRGFSPGWPAAAVLRAISKVACIDDRGFPAAALSRSPAGRSTLRRVALTAKRGPRARAPRPGPCQTLYMRRCFGHRCRALVPRSAQRHSASRSEGALLQRRLQAIRRRNVARSPARRCPRADRASRPV